MEKMAHESKTKGWVMSESNNIFLFNKNNHRQHILDLACIAAQF